jgi:Hg(II)-responsive transcriptional regulator
MAGMRSSEVASRAGVNTQTLRYYERRGLLEVPPRSASGYRAYPAGAVAAVRFIKRAQAHGFSLDQIEELLHLADGGPADCAAARQLARTKMAELAGKIAELQRMKRSLAELVATCDLPRTERRCPMIRALYAEGEAHGTADPPHF